MCCWLQSQCQGRPYQAGLTPTGREPGPVLPCAMCIDFWSKKFDSIISMLDARPVSQEIFPSVQSLHSLWLLSVHCSIAESVRHRYPLWVNQVQTCRCHTLQQTFYQLTRHNNYCCHFKQWIFTNILSHHKWKYLRNTLCSQQWFLIAPFLMLEQCHWLFSRGKAERSWGGAAAWLLPWRRSRRRSFAVNMLNASNVHFTKTQHSSASSTVNNR